MIHVAAGLPKTRSGKIMRRILRKIAAGEYTGLGDTTTLADPEVVERLLEMLNRRVHPIVPSQGSVGASGDLAPLAHLALAAIGEGDAQFEGERMPAREALLRADVRPLDLEAKEGLSLINGTQG